MSHELVLVAGSPADAERRDLVLQHAAGAVPGSVSLRRAGTATVEAAVVETAHPGGSVASLSAVRGGTRLTVALAPSGLAAAGSADPRGAEGAHATVLLEQDGGLTVSTDGVALVPVFWWAGSGVLVASTHLATLVSLGAPAVPDEVGAVEYLTFHHPLGTRTLLAGCRMLEAGAVLRWADGRVDVRRRPALFDLSAAPAARPDDAVLADVADTWTDVVADTVDGGGRVGIGLSGGMDSRTIAGAAAQQGRRVLTFTYGDSRSAETRVAARVAEALELPHLTLPVDDARVLAGARETLAHLDGAHSPNEMYETWFADDLRGVVDTVVNGHGGDPQWGNAKGIGLTDRAAVHAVLWHRYRGHAALAARFLEGSLGRAAEELAEESLADSLAGWDFAERADVAVAWAMENRQRRWGNMLVTALRRTGLRPQTPFLDRRFLALSSTFSPQQRLNGALYLRLQNGLLASTAGIPRSDDGNAPRRLTHLYWSSESSRGSQLARLVARRPLPGLRRGAHHGLDLLAGRLGGLAAAQRHALDRAVFPSDVWLTTRPVYADRLRVLLQQDGAPLLSQRAMEHAARSVGSGRPAAPAAVLGRVAALGGWLADYAARADAYRALSGAPVPSHR